MIARADIDAREFNRAIAQLSKGIPKLAVQIANQTALDVSREWFNVLPPPINQVRAKRREIRSYLRAVVGNKRLTRKERKAGRVPLMRLHLIVQSRRRKSGQRGLYGQRAQSSVGYLKAMFLPVIRALNPVVRFKMPNSETGGTAKLSIWPGSKGHGRARLAAGSNPLAILNLAWNFKGPREGLALVLKSSTVEATLQDLSCCLHDRSQIFRRGEAMPVPGPTSARTRGKLPLILVQDTVPHLRTESGRPGYQAAHFEEAIAGLIQDLDIRLRSRRPHSRQLDVGKNATRRRGMIE